MIPTVSILSERIHRILKKGDIQRDTEWDPRDFEYLVRDVTSKLIKGDWYETRNEGGKNIDSRYLASFTETVQKDNNGDNFCVIPVSNWIRLPDDSGIQSCRPDIATLTTKKTKEHEFRAFIPIPNRFLDIFANLPAGALEGQHGFMVRKNKLFFTKRYEKTVLDNGIKKVELDIVTVDPAAVGIDEPLPLPSEMISGVILGVLEILGVSSQKAKDLINNENPNK